MGFDSHLNWFPDPIFTTEPDLSTLNRPGSTWNWRENNTGPLLPAIDDPAEINYMKPDAHLSREPNPDLLGVDIRFGQEDWVHGSKDDVLNQPADFSWMDKLKTPKPPTGIDPLEMQKLVRQARQESQAGLMPEVPLVKLNPAVQAKLDRIIKENERKQELINWQPEPEPEHPFLMPSFEPLADPKFDKRRKILAHLDKPHPPYGHHADLGVSLEMKTEPQVPVIDLIKLRIGTQGEVLSEEIGFRNKANSFRYGDVPAEVPVPNYLTLKMEHNQKMIDICIENGWKWEWEDGEVKLKLG